MHQWKYPIYVVCWILSFQITSLSACPPITNVVDFNCDRELKFVFVGDSFVRGRGDTRNGNVGGYVRRVKRHYNGVTVVNYGQPGYTASQLYQQLREEFTRNKVLAKRMRGADFILVDIGRNAYFKDTPPSLVVRDIKRVVSLLRRELKSVSGAPYIAVATQAPNTRSYQFRYVEEINNHLIARSTSKFPVLFEFDSLPKRIISGDGLHPTSKGYRVISRYIEKTLEGAVRERQLSQRPDLDNDGVFDKFEARQFGTDPSLSDTDGDGFLDGVEIFELDTDPLVANEMEL